MKNDKKIGFQDLLKMEINELENAVMTRYEETHPVRYISRWQRNDLAPGSLPLVTFSAIEYWSTLLGLGNMLTALKPKNS